MANLDAFLTNGLFWALAVVVVGSAAIVAFSSSLVRAGFSLLFTFAGVGALYLFLGADFLGIAQIAIYVGGILVLILFGVMFTQGAAQHLPALQQSLQRPSGAFVVFAVMLPMVIGTVFAASWPQTDTSHGRQPTTAGIGEQLLTTYLLPFEVASVLLLVALVGAVVLTRRGRELKQEILGGDERTR